MKKSPLKNKNAITQVDSTSYPNTNYAYEKKLNLKKKNETKSVACDRSHDCAPFLVQEMLCVKYEFENNKQINLVPRFHKSVFPLHRLRFKPRFFPFSLSFFFSVLQLVHCIIWCCLFVFFLSSISTLFMFSSFHFHFCFCFYFSCSIFSI